MLRKYFSNYGNFMPTCKGVLHVPTCTYREPVLSFKKSGFYDFYILQIFVREVLVTYYFAGGNIRYVLKCYIHLPEFDFKS